MMQAIRTKAGSIVVKILFGLLIVSFGFWGIYTRSDYFQGHSPDTVIATVGSQNIRAETLQQALQPALERLRAQLGTSIDAQQVKQLGILDTLLGQLIDRSLIEQQTRGSASKSPTTPSGARSMTTRHSGARTVSSIASFLARCWRRTG